MCLYLHLLTKLPWGFLSHGFVTIHVWDLIPIGSQKHFWRARLGQLHLVWHITVGNGSVWTEPRNRLLFWKATCFCLYYFVTSKVFQPTQRKVIVLLTYIHMVVCINLPTRVYVSIYPLKYPCNKYEWANALTFFFFYYNLQMHTIQYTQSTYIHTNFLCVYIFASIFWLQSFSSFILLRLILIIIFFSLKRNLRLY